MLAFLASHATLQPQQAKWPPSRLRRSQVIICRIGQEAIVFINLASDKGLAFIDGIWAVLVPLLLERSRLDRPIAV
jgi:hypothetical protein